MKEGQGHWRERATIPNTEGYELEVLTDRGEIQTKVVKVDGLHVLEGVKIGDVLGWRPVV